MAAAAAAAAATDLGMHEVEKEKERVQIACAERHGILYSLKSTDMHARGLFLKTLCQCAARCVGH